MTLLKCMPDHLCSWSFVLFRSVIVYKTIHVISRIVNGCDIVQILSSERELINCSNINWLGQRPLIFSPWIFHPYYKRMRRPTIFWFEAELFWNSGKSRKNKDKDWYQTLLCIWNTYIFVKVVSVSHSPSGPPKYWRMPQENRFLSDRRSNHCVAWRDVTLWLWQKSRWQEKWWSWSIVIPCLRTVFAID